MKNATYRLLVVDDNPAIHEDFKKIFGLNQKDSDLDALASQVFGDSPDSFHSKSCFRLDFASQGKEALEMVNNAIKEGRPYALTFMDIRMPPGWDGIETITRLWEVAPDLQVVICTAYSDYNINEIAAKLEHQERFVVLKKPFDIIEVQQMANAFTEKWSMLHQLRERATKLEESERRYRFLAEAVPDIVWTAYGDGRPDYVNRQFEKYCGRTFDHVRDHGWTDLLHPDDRDKTIERWNRSLQTGEAYQAEFRLFCAEDGSYRWHLSRAVAMRGSDGQILHWFGTTTNIHDQKHVEELLRQSQIKLEQRVAERTSELAKTRFRLDSLLNSSPAIIYSTEPEPSGLMTFVSRNVTAILGIEPAELMANKDAWLSRVHPDDVSVFAARTKELQRKNTNRVEYRFRHKDGTYRWIHDEARVSGHSGNGPGEIVGYCIDVTPLKQIEDERRRMEIQLRQGQKLEAIGQLAAGIAHEINTPTQYVGDNARFLQDSFRDMEKVLQSHIEFLSAAKVGKITPESIAEAAQVLACVDLEYLFDQVPAALKETLEGVDRITRIVRAMKEFSHPGGKEKSAADLNKAIESTVTVARNEWKYVADLNLDLDPQLPPVACYLGEFNQVVLNLVINASHAIADVVRQAPGTKGVIAIQTRKVGNHAEIRVGDTGTGIPEAVRSRIFEPFFTTKDVGKGTGQGLSIVYGSVVNKHGGTVTFESEVGKGTTFIIRLPLGAPECRSQSTDGCQESQPESIAA